jgi:hypothetical protein
MSEMRFTGTRPPTRDRATKSSVEHEDNWDNRFWLNSMPDYNPLRDKLSSRTGSRRKSTLLPQISSKLVSSQDSHVLKAMSRSVKPAPRRREVSSERLRSLKSELQDNWSRWSVPEFHQQAFLKSVNSKPSTEAMRTMAQELKAIQSEEAAITQAMKAVQTRESLLEKLKDFRLSDESSTQSIVKQNEAADLLMKYRAASIEVVELITEWKRQYKTEHLKFIWEGQNYLAKMRLDAAFMKHSDLGRIFSFPSDNDTFLVFISAPKPQSGLRLKKSSSTKRNVNLPLSSVMLSRLKKAQIQLKLEASDEKDAFEVYEFVNRTPREIHLTSEPEISWITATNPGKSSKRASFNKRPDSPVRPQPQKKTFVPSLLMQTLVMKKARLGAEQFSEIAGFITAELIEEVVKFEVPVFARESVAEVLVAALVLYSSNILDRIILEALHEMVPEVAKESWSEETDIEYLDIQAMIIESVTTSEVLSGVEMWVDAVLAQEIEKCWVRDVYFEDIVQEAIDEEVAWNARIIAEVYSSFIDDIMSEEWVELLAENELEEALLDSKRLEMNPALQKELYNREKRFFIGKIADSMWFDWLNLIIADTWLPRVVEATLNDEDLCDDQLFMHEYVEERTKNRSQPGMLNR